MVYAVSLFREQSSRIDGQDLRNSLAYAEFFSWVSGSQDVDEQSDAAAGSAGCIHCGWNDVLVDVQCRVEDGNVLLSFLVLLVVGDDFWVVDRARISLDGCAAEGVSDDHVNEDVSLWGLVLQVSQVVLVPYGWVGAYGGRGVDGSAVRREGVGNVVVSLLDCELGLAA